MVPFKVVAISVGHKFVTLKIIGENIREDWFEDFELTEAVLFSTSFFTSLIMDSQGVLYT